MLKKKVNFPSIKTSWTKAPNPKTEICSHAQFKTFLTNIELKFEEMDQIEAGLYLES